MVRICLIVLVSFLMLSACGGHATVVRRDQFGGTLALQGNQDIAMANARDQMAAHCGGQYVITREERVVVGQQTSGGERTRYREGENGRGDTRGAANTRHQTVTSDVHEYQVTYQCGSSPGGAGQATPVQVIEPPKSEASR